MTNSLYVKMRGRVIGPFDEQRLVQMVQQGQLSRASLVSSDGDNWQKAGAVSSLFRQDSLSSPATKTAERPAIRGPLSQPEEVWHYGSGAESHGPVSATTIQALITKGRVGPKDTVWQEGMEDWEPLNSVSEFAGFFPSPESPAPIQIETKAKTESEIEKAFSETARLTTASAPWVAFISVVAFVFSAVLFFGSLFILIKGAQAESVVLITNGVLGFVQVAIMIGGAVLLNRFSAACKKFQYTNRASDLNDALGWLGKFWVLAGIVMIMAVIFFVIALIFSYATGATFT